MKKMIVILAVLTSSLSSFAGKSDVSPKVLNAFNKEFNTAKEVEWTAGNDYYTAAFTYNDKRVFAFYNAEGELLGLTRYISPVDLPLGLQTNLKKKYSDYWISDLFEVDKTEGTSYYLTLENGDSKVVVKSTADNDWTVYKKTVKL